MKSLEITSKIRVKNSSDFSLIKKRSKLYASKEKYAIPISYEGFFAYYHNNPSVKSPKESKKNTIPFEVKNPSYLTAITDLTLSQKEVNEKAISDIKRDVYVKEAFEIVTELIEINNH